MRIAETRAVNRALRKAYGIGLCSVEELGWSSTPAEPRQTNGSKSFSINGNGHGNGQPRLRDQLCLLIRQYNLDPTLVKAYAAHFCGTETLKDASRDLVESFISHLSGSAKEDRAGLLCKLNSFRSNGRGAAMNRRIPGLHSTRKPRARSKGCFSFGSNGLPIGGIRRNLLSVSVLSFLNPVPLPGALFSGRFYCTETGALETQLVSA